MTGIYAPADTRRFAEILIFTVIEHFRPIPAVFPPIFSSGGTDNGIYT